jgi:hypothetical protein
MRDGGNGEAGPDRQGSAHQPDSRSPFPAFPNPARIIRVRAGVAVIENVQLQPVLASRLLTYNKRRVTKGTGLVCQAMATSPIFIVIGLKFAVVSMSLVSNDPAWMWRK